MKYYSLIILLIFSFSCQVEKDVDSLTLTAFSESAEYDDFSAYNVLPVETTDEKEYEHSISLVGESSQMKYFRFDETIRFKPYIIDSLHHWIPVISHTTTLIDTSILDFQIKSFAGFNKWTSREHWSRLQNPELVNELFAQSMVQLTNSKFVDQPESGDKKTSSIQLESAGDIFSISINYAYTSDSLLLTPTVSGEDTFIEFLRRDYGIDEKLILKLSDDLK